MKHNPSWISKDDIEKAFDLSNELISANQKRAVKLHEPTQSDGKKVKSILKNKPHAAPKKPPRLLSHYFAIRDRAMTSDLSEQRVACVHYVTDTMNAMRTLIDIAADDDAEKTKILKSLEDEISVVAKLKLQVSTRE